MAEELDDGVFWLPSEFLTDDDDLLTSFSSDITETDDVMIAANDFPTQLSTSPQSTLCPGSSRGSPNSISPPDVNGLDFLYAAAQEVATMRMLEQQFYSSGFYPTQTFSYQQQRVWGHENVMGMRNNGLGFWPTSQQMGKRIGSGVFVGERTGTGVFLPRRMDQRKQPGCSVVLPDKVVHALNLGVGLKQRNDIKMNNLRPVVKQQELGLPLEWTY